MSVAIGELSSQQGMSVPQPFEYTPTTPTSHISKEFVTSGCLIARVLLGGQRPTSPRLINGRLYSVPGRPGSVERVSVQQPLDAFGRERRCVQDKFQIHGVSQFGGLYDTAVVWRGRTELRVPLDDPRRLRLDNLAITLGDDIEQIRPQIALHYECTPGNQATYIRLNGQVGGGGHGALASTFNPSRRLRDCDTWVAPVLHTMAASMQALATLSVSSLVPIPQQSPRVAAEINDPYAETDSMRERALIVAHCLLPDRYQSS